MDLGIKGRTALVLGASRGIGRGIASSLAREGARVAIASRSPDDLVKAAAEIEGDVMPVGAETENLEHLATVPGEVAKEYGPIEILVANTGGPPPGGPLENDTDQWQAAYTSLVLAPKVLVEAVVPGVRGRKWGRVGNVGPRPTLPPSPGLNLSTRRPGGARALFKSPTAELWP